MLSRILFAVLYAIGTYLVLTLLVLVVAAFGVNEVRVLSPFIGLIALIVGILAFLGSWNLDSWRR